MDFVIHRQNLLTISLNEWWLVQQVHCLTSIACFTHRLINKPAWYYWLKQFIFSYLQITKRHDQILKSVILCQIITITNYYTCPIVYNFFYIIVETSQTYQLILLVYLGVYFK